MGEYKFNDDETKEIAISSPFIALNTDLAIKDLCERRMTSILVSGHEALYTTTIGFVENDFFLRILFTAENEFENFMNAFMKFSPVTGNIQISFLPSQREEDMKTAEEVCESFEMLDCYCSKFTYKSGDIKTLLKGFALAIQHTKTFINDVDELKLTLNEKIFTRK